VKTTSILRALWFTAGLALVLGIARDAVLSVTPAVHPLALADRAAEGAWFSGGFRTGGVYPATVAGMLPPNILETGSWLDGDEWQGRAETAWFDAPQRTISVAVAGYPQHAGCSLRAEFQYHDGTITRLDCDLKNPHEQWRAWRFDPPEGALALRLVAEDQADDHSGWLAFSQPYRQRVNLLTPGYMLAQVFATAALAFVILWGPGLLWRPRNARPETRLVFLLGAGPLLLAAAGVLIWVVSGTLRPGPIAFVLVAALWLALGIGAWRRGFALEITAPMRRMLAVALLVVVAAAAKSTYSAGPEGELFRGGISRNLSVGDRVDTRYPFYIVQLATHHIAPSSPQAEGFFYPWTFFSRGPLAGLAMTPLVLATGGRPDSEQPDQPWSPFDDYGFAAYRMGMLALASGVLFAVFMMLVPFVGERWALVAGGLLALSPFGVHEVMFTWPKFAATAWTIASFALAHARRPLAAGIVLAVGFLFHPMTLLWAPWIALWAAGRAVIRTVPVTPDKSIERSESWSRGAPAAVIQRITARAPRRYQPLVRSGAAALGVAVGAGVIALPWMAIGAAMPHLPDTPFAGQGNFLRYWTQADWHLATWQTWWQTRWMNFANTFVPVHVYFSGFDHHKFTSAYEPSGRLVKFSFVWWNSLPFGLGLGLWVVSLVAVARALRMVPAAAWLFAVLPALFITAYWGMDPLGLMRECGHPLFVAIVALTCVVAARQAGTLQRILLHRAVPWLQLPETLLMLWLTTLLNANAPGVNHPELDPMYLAINVAALAAAAWVISAGRGAAREPEVTAARAVPAMPVS
jgi:hypothetical protein